MVRSLENFPESATFRIAFRAQASGLEYRAHRADPHRDRLQIGKMHIVIPAGQKRLAQRIEDARFVAAEVVGEDHVQGGACFRLVL